MNPASEPTFPALLVHDDGTISALPHKGAWPYDPDLWSWSEPSDFMVDHCGIHFAQRDGRRIHGHPVEPPIWHAIRQLSPSELKALILAYLRAEQFDPAPFHAAVAGVSESQLPAFVVDYIFRLDAPPRSRQGPDPQRRSSADETPLKRNLKRGCWWLAFLGPVLLVSLAVLFVCFVPVRGPRPKSRVTMQLSKLVELRHYLLEYADEHTGQFPDSYAAVVPKDVPAGTVQFQDPSTSAKSDWLYFSGHNMDDGPGVLLMASPRAVGADRSRRIVLYCDGSAAIIPETEFQRKLALQTSP